MKQLWAWRLVTAFMMCSGIAMIPSVASATTSPPMYPTHIVLNGIDLTDPQHLVAKEYPTANTTSWLPIWYLFDVLHNLKVTSEWDGQHWNLEVPAEMSANLDSLPKSQAIGANEISIMVNGEVVAYAPRMTAKDPGGTQMTTYVPIWYVMQAMKRIGVQYSWDGTTWSMTHSSASPDISKLQAVKDFVNTLQITPDGTSTNPFDDVSSMDWPIVHAAIEKGYFLPDNVTHFGSSDNVARHDMDHAYQLYMGIPDSHMSWNAGGNTDAWGTAIHLNQGVGDGALTDNSEQVMIGNLAALYNGYTVANGTYHLWFQPYDAYKEFVKNEFVTQSMVMTQEAKAIQYIDEVTFRIAGANQLSFVIPSISDQVLNELSCGAIFNPSGNITDYSINKGATWKKAQGVFGYDSRDPQNGGTNSAVAQVLVRTMNNAEIGESFLAPKNDVTFALVNFSPNGTATPTIKYGVKLNEVGIS